MASYERMPINGKLRSRSKSGDLTTLPPSTVARSARATALQFCGLEFHTRNETFSALIADFRFRHSNDATAGLVASPRLQATLPTWGTLNLSDTVLPRWAHNQMPRRHSMTLAGPTALMTADLFEKSQHRPQLMASGSSSRYPRLIEAPRMI